MGACCRVLPHHAPRRKLFRGAVSFFPTGPASRRVAPGVRVNSRGRPPLLPPPSPPAPHGMWRMYFLGGGGIKISIYVDMFNGAYFINSLLSIINEEKLLKLPKAPGSGRKLPGAALLPLPAGGAAGPLERAWISREMPPIRRLSPGGRLATFAATDMRQ